ncbi:MAG: tRNA uridine-5-carboxymethylaminomethyl(34) synthesis GTPase MnmE [Bacilli bacterium]|jgi:tRNA modification GTPase|nr:tRNA uridine-5-carboxymethylaminomethyl(34) synthesis GTPase MnmE [Acholeplasmataceae bacterium]
MMNETIVAISTALGKSAISIVRLSGEEAISIVAGCFKGKDLTTVNSHTVHYGHIFDESGIIDEVLVSVFRAPRTYTREDIVEIGTHGGIYVTNRILELMLERGCRLAEPGEFTKRAFLNGRIDLTQAESVCDIIEAKTAASLKMANYGLRGDVRKMIEDFRRELTGCITRIEVNIDYPEYEDEEITLAELLPLIEALESRIENILSKAETSAILREGITTAIIGPPNVGKSSLLNALLREEKAIVTEIPGTTRDIVEGRVNIGGIILNLIDTAGIRYAADIVEKIGVEKTKQVIEEAALIILVFDYNAPLTNLDKEILEMTSRSTRITVINKNDLEPRIDLSLFDDYLLMSTFNPEDIEKLERKIKETLHISDISEIDYTYLGNARQIAKLKQAKQALSDALHSLNGGQPIDIVNIDLVIAWRHLSDILGEKSSVEIIDEIFANFCLGK